MYQCSNKCNRITIIPINMKKYLFLFAVGFSADIMKAQTIEENETPSFWERVKIAESMSTAEQKESPAQFQMTFPKNDPASWLLNLGLSYGIFPKAQKSISKIGLEYHRNTLTDQEQNNFQTGYGITQLLTNSKRNRLYLDADIKYVYDGIKIKNSLASNLFFSFFNDGGQKGLNLNVPKYFNQKKQTILITNYFGPQLQSIFKAKDVTDEGFILRPLFNVTAQYDFNKKKDSTENKFAKPKPLVRLFADYTGRYDAINTTDHRENYTQLFKNGIEYYIAYNPLKVSIGASFNYGSDPRAGLENNNFGLLA